MQATDVEKVKSSLMEFFVPLIEMGATRNGKVNFAAEAAA
jgi:hypothetical protein